MTLLEPEFRPSSNFILNNTRLMNTVTWIYTENILLETII